MSERETIEREAQSEFGAGVVVCLAKFSEHLWNWAAERYLSGVSWAEKSEDDKAKFRAEAKQFPYGDAARTVAMAESTFSQLHKKPEESLSRALEMWANGASDHFYDLDRDKAPPALCELADLTLEMGHGFTGKLWTHEDWKRIHELWQQSCLELDRSFGTEPDWGQW